MKNQSIQGTPWNISFGDSKKDDRRHKKRCIYYRGVNNFGKKINYCSYCLSNCIGSAHCSYYNENKHENYYEMLKTESKPINKSNNKHKRKDSLQDCLQKILCMKKLSNIFEKQTINLSSTELNMIKRFVNFSKEKIEQMIVESLRISSKNVIKFNFENFLAMSKGESVYTFKYICNKNKSKNKKLEIFIEKLVNKFGVRIIYQDLQIIKLNNEDADSLVNIINSIYINSTLNYSISFLEFAIKKSINNDIYHCVIFNQSSFKTIIKHYIKTHNQ